MRVSRKLCCCLVVITLVPLAPVCSAPVNAKSGRTVDELTALAIAAKENLAAVDAQSKQADSDLKTIAAKLNTDLAEFKLSSSRTIELLNDLAREENRAARLTKGLTVQSAALKVRKDNEAIELGMKEAAEKAETAMAAAQMQLYLGLVIGRIQVSGASALFQADTPGFTNLLSTNLPNLNLTVLEMRNDVGITLRVRVGKAISCLSSKQQCSGRSYLISR